MQSRLDRPKTQRPARERQWRAALVVAAAAGAVASLAPRPALAASDAWDGEASAVWTTGTNWVTNPAAAPGSGETATFSGAGGGNTTIDLGGGVTINAILFDTSSAAAYTIGSGAAGSQTLTLNNAGAITTNAAVANSQLINAALLLGTDGSAQTFTVTNNSLAGPLSFAGGITGSSGTGVKTFAVGGAGAVNIGGVIGNGTTGSVAFRKTGLGTVTLSNQNTYTGTTVVQGGALNLDFGAATAPVSNMVSSSSALTLGAAGGAGGRLILTGKAATANTQTFSNLALGAGANKITLTPGASGGTAALTITNAVTVPSATNHGTIQYSTSGTTTLAGNLNVATFGVATTASLYATYGTDDYAATDGAGVVKAATYVDSPTGAGSDFTPVFAVQNIVGDITHPNVANDPQALRFADTTGRTVTNNDPSLFMAGILVASTAGPSTIDGTGAIKQFSNTGDFFVFQNSPNDFTVSSSFANNASGRNMSLVKAGAGKMILSGANSNGGGTFINEGTIQVGNGGATGNLGTGGVTNQGALIYNRTGTLVDANVITGPGTVTFAGPGEVHFTTNANTYTGATNVNAGLLGITQASNIPSASVVTLNGGGLKFLNASAIDLSGKTIVVGAGGATLDTNGKTVGLGTASLTGSGALAKNGLGTLTMPSGGAYTGNLTINGGTVLANNTLNASSVTVNSGGTIAGTGTIANGATLASGGRVSPGNGGVGTLTVGSLSLGAGSQLDYDIAGTSSLDQTVVTASGGLTINGGSLNINGGATPFTANGIYNLIGYTGTIGGTGVSALNVGSTSANLGTNTYTFGTAGGFVTLVVGSAGAGPTYWNADAPGNWSTGPWTAPTPNSAGAFAAFGGGGAIITDNRTITVDGAYTVGTLSFNNPTFSYTLAPGTGAGITLDGATSAAFVTNSAGNHAVQVPLTMTSNGATFAVTNPADTLTVSGAVDGGGAVLTKVGAGTLLLSGNNTYTGGTKLNGGAIAINSATSLGDAGGALTFGGGTLKLLGDVTSSRSYLVSGTQDASINTNGSNLTYAGVIAPVSGGSGGLVKSGAGTLILQTANTYVGTTTLAGGTLSISANDQLGDVATGAGLIFNGGTLAPTTTLALDNAGANIRPVTLSAGGGTIDVPDTTTTTVRGFVDGVGALTKTSNGTLTLSGGNAYSGGTVLQAGRVIANNNTALGSGGVTMSDGTTLHLQGVGSGSISVGNPITTVAGATATITANNAASGYFGTITGAATDTISISGAGGAQVSFSLGANTQQFGNFLGTVRVESGASLRFSSTSSVNNGGGGTSFNVIGDLQTRNAGTINLGELTGTGSLIGSTGGTGIATFSVGAKGTSSTFDGVISDSNASIGRVAALTKTGAGTLTLTGNHTYTGATAANGGKLLFNQSLTTSSSLNASGTGTIALASGGGKVFKIAAVTATGTGKIDLADNRLIVTNVDAAAAATTVGNLTTLLRNGYANGGWTGGAGIITTATDAAPATHLTALGVAVAGDVGLTGQSWAGQVLADTDAVVMYTYGGDANLDGKLNGDDYFRIDSNVNAPGASGWSNGDFNYDGKLNGDDYFIIDSNIGRQGTAIAFPAGGGITESSGIGGVTVVPEPGSIGGLLTAAACGVAARRRRRRSSSQPLSSW
ncbi:MAG TPA: autotransporter-associated beta strand repeat-containing protein [Tepidisphaeraceae bacterium]|nr:autotransporter-associated beta strand repeat-containing protein [Tepidisphaeraceae bacterium]